MPQRINTVEMHVFKMDEECMKHPEKSSFMQFVTMFLLSRKISFGAKNDCSTNKIVTNLKELFLFWRGLVSHRVDVPF